MSGTLSTDEFYTDLKIDFQKNCLVGKNFSHYSSIRTRELCRCSIKKCLLQNKIFSFENEARNYSSYLENYIYFKQSCIIDIHYKNEIRKYVNVLKNVGHYIFEKYSIQEFARLPEHLIRRGSKQHQASLKKKIQHIFFGIKNRKILEQTKNEIDIYKDIAQSEKNPEKKHIFENIYTSLNQQFENATCEKDDDNFPESFEKCRKCKSYRTSYVEFQTRSADEPMTLFFTCHDCANHWRK